MRQRGRKTAFTESYFIFSILDWGLKHFWDWHSTHMQWIASINPFILKCRSDILVCFVFCMQNSKNRILVSDESETMMIWILNVAAKCKLRNKYYVIQYASNFNVKRNISFFTKWLKRWRAETILFDVQRQDFSMFRR